jgi:hypothetical protein
LREEIPLPSGGSISVVRQPVSGPLEIGPDELESILSGEEEAMPEEVRDFEKIPSGLAEYF